MSKQPVEVRLIVLTGNRVGEEIIVAEEATLGRLAACDLHFEDKLASRRHAKVRVGPDGVYLEDLGSSNGTQLHGERIREARLEDGDQIEIGHTRIRVRIESARPQVRSEAEPEAVAGGFEEIQLDGLEDEIEREGAGQAAEPAPGKAPATATPDVRPRSAPVQPEAAGAAVGAVKPGAPKGRATKGQRGKGGGLQYHRIEDRGGLLGEDLWQRSGLSRILILALVLAAGAVLFMLAYHAMS